VELERTARCVGCGERDEGAARVRFRRELRVVVGVAGEHGLHDHGLDQPRHRHGPEILVRRVGHAFAVEVARLSGGASRIAERVVPSEDLAVAVGGDRLEHGHRTTPSATLPSTHPSFPSAVTMKPP
jgi:hypothetical protein